MHAARDPTGAHEHQPLAALGVLVGELHRNSAPHRVSDYGGALDTEDAQKVSHPVRVRTDGVVGARLVGGPMPEEIRRDDHVVLREGWDHLGPRRGTVSDTVNQEERWALAHAYESALVAVYGPKLHLAVRPRVG